MSVDCNSLTITSFRDFWTEFGRIVRLSEFDNALFCSYKLLYM